MVDEDGELRRAPKWAPMAMASLIEQPQPGFVGGSSDPSTPAPDPEIGRVIRGKYRIVEQLGAGGMAVVYRAEEQGMIRRDVAIKLLKPESGASQAMLTRFLKEAQAIAAINHPNVVQLIDIDRTDEGQIYLVMERMVGKTLHQVLRDMYDAGETFTWERLGPLMLQACRALHAAHRQKIIHRDMKPSNCFCCNLEEDEWHLKILDFGIAKASSGTGASADSMETPLTQDGMFIGTPHYAAPEVIRQSPDHVIDGRADIFALGVMMYQCLTGSLPFHGAHQDKFTVLYRTLHERAQPPRERAPEQDIPLQVDALIMRAMEADPNKRFASVAELADGIRATLRSASDFSGAGISLSRGAGFEQTPRPPGERAPLRSPPIPASTPAPDPSPAAPGNSSASVAIAGLDQATPTPPGEQLVPASSPTAIQQISPRTSLGVLVAVGVMSLGVLALMTLFLYEATGVTAPAPAIPAPHAPRPAVEPVRRPQAAPPATPPPGALEAPSPTPALEIIDDPPATATKELAEGTPTPPKSKSSDTQATRAREVKALLNNLVKSRAMDKCLPLTFGAGDGIYDELPVKVQVDPKGQAKATASSKSVKHRLPKSSDACILKVIQSQGFPESAVVVTHTLRFD